MSLIRRENPYTKTIWYDRIIDITTGQLLQEGTRFNQKRANNIEDGIYNAYEYYIELESLVKRMQAQLEIDGRVPGNSGSFFDTFDGKPARLIILPEITDVTTAVTSTEKVIPVADASKFEAMTFATIYDANSYEDIYITAVDEGAKTITVQALTSDYTKGAKVARSTASIDTVNQTMDVAPFTIFNVELVEVV